MYDIGDYNHIDAWLYPKKPLIKKCSKYWKIKLAWEVFQGEWERSFVNKNYRKIFCYKKMSCKISDDKKKSSLLKYLLTFYDKVFVV